MRHVTDMLGASESNSAVDQCGGLTRRDLIICMLLLALSAIVLGKGITIGGPRGDSAARMMDGVLIHDWVAAGPSAWTDPFGFAVTQYSYYPSLGIGRMYPPGFALVEAGFFAAFGISPISARFCTLTFALLTLLGVYLLMRRFYGPIEAVGAVVALLAMPAVVRWSRQTSLEMATLSVLVFSALAAFHYRSRPTFLRLVVWLALALGSVTFKQMAPFVVLPYSVLLAVWVFKKEAPWWHLLFAGGATVSVAVGCYMLLSIGSSSTHSLEVVTGGASFWGMMVSRDWSYYARLFPYTVGTWVAILALFGLLVSLFRRNALTAMMVIWLASFYAMSSVIDAKEPRYFFFGLLPFAVWAGLGVGWLIARLPWTRLRAMAVVGFALFVGVVSFGRSIPFRPDYGPMVLAHQDSIEGGVVLFDGLRDADFTFALRQHLGQRKCVVVRTSKLLYSCATKPKYRFQSYVDSPEALESTLKDFAFDAIVVEREPLIDLDEERLLRALLAKSEDYLLHASITITPGPGLPSTPLTETTVDLYRPRRPMIRTATDYNIVIPSDDRNFSINLETLVAGMRAPT